MNEKAPVDLAKAEPHARRARGRDHPHVLPLDGEAGEGTFVKRGRYEKVRERARDDLVRERLVDVAAEGHDPAEGRDRVSIQGPCIGRGKVLGNGNATRVRVLDDHRCSETASEAEALRADQRVSKLPRRIRVEQVQVGQLPPTVLDGPFPPAGGIAAAR